MITIPEDFPVQPISGPPWEPGAMTCGTCGLTWNDSIPTSMTPVPSGRCPFEYFHEPEPLPMVEHVRRAVLVLTEHELSPSTRDLLALEGCAVADWLDREEKLDLIDAILSEYEAQAVAYIAPGNRYAATVVRAIVAARQSVQEAKKGGVAA